MTADLTPEFRQIWKEYRATTLLALPELARLVKVKRVFVKIEGERPHGNFKVLGGSVAALRALARAVGVTSIDRLATAPRESLPTLMCASDGNHGLAVAAAAQRVHARACIYLPRGVSPVRAERIRALGGHIHWVAGTYDDAVRAAEASASCGKGLLIPDTSADPGDPVVRDVMAGYGILSQELTSQFADLGERPSHVFVQAGVGGLAAALASRFADFARAPNRTVVVEPASAGCVARALIFGHPDPVPGNLHTTADMLSCGVASAPALEILRAHGATSVLVSEGELQHAVGLLRAAGGPATTPSGAAGLAGLVHVAARSSLRSQYEIGADSSALLIASEGPVSGGRAEHKRSGPREREADTKG